MSAREIRDWYRAAPGYWFRPKLFGYGAVPVTWHGWAATLGLIALALAIGVFAEGRSFVYLALVVPLLLGFIWLCWTKTDGEWKWRWGDRD